MVIGLVVIMRIKMYQKVRYTCRFVVLLVKPLVCRFSLSFLLKSSPQLLKLPNQDKTTSIPQCQ